MDDNLIYTGVLVVENYLYIKKYYTMCFTQGINHNLSVN